MPEKSVREMTDLERKYHSLEAHVFHATIMGAIILGIAALIIGLGLYVYALAGQYIGEAFSLSKSVSTMVTEITDISKYSDSIMKIYREVDPKAANKVGDASYNKNFKDIVASDDYETLRRVLKSFAMSGDVDDVYIVNLDLEKNRMVYLVDPDNKLGSVMMPGEYESVPAEYLKKFMEWDGEEKLYQFDYIPEYGFYCIAGFPVKDMNGNLKACIFSEVSLRGMRRPIILFLIQYFIVMTIVTIILGLLMARHMKKKLVAPINQIADAAQNYSDDKKSGSGNHDHFRSLDIDTGDEVENLALNLADMEQDLEHYEENLTRVTKEKARINTELNLATRIQADMLPSIYPAFPERKEFDIYASMDPAKEVGGDFYDFFLVDDDHLCMVMADVSGKGIPAALFMMASKIILSNNAMMSKSPAKVLEDTNNAFSKTNREEMFVTVWLGILEISTGKLTAANAGHEFPVLMHAGNDFELIKDKHGFVIGGMPGMKYKDYELQLEPGSKLFLYTDGVPEATDANNELFGTDRMLDALNKSKGLEPEKILEKVRYHVDGFVGEAEQFDDLTMLCMEWLGPGEGTSDGEED